MTGEGTACSSLIAADIEVTCGNQIVPGYESVGYIINREDMVTKSSEITNSSVSKIELKTGKKAYKVVIPGSTPFTGTNVSIEKGVFSNTFKNTVSLVILNSGASVTSDIIKPLKDGTFVVILERKFISKAGDSRYECYGLVQGLKLETGSKDPNAEDTDGGWKVDLVENKSSEEAVYIVGADFDPASLLTPATS